MVDVWFFRVFGRPWLGLANFTRTFVWRYFTPRALAGLPPLTPSCRPGPSDGSHSDRGGGVGESGQALNRVQEVAGNYSDRHSGSMLPPPVDEHFHEHSSPTVEPVLNICVKVSACAIGNSADSLAFPEMRDHAVRPSKQMTTFVDSIGNSCSSWSDKNGNSFKDEKILNLRSDLSSTHVDRRTYVEADNSGSNLSNSSSSQAVNGLSLKEFSIEPSKESSKVLLRKRDDTTHNDPFVTTDDSSLTSHHMLKDSSGFNEMKSQSLHNSYWINSRSTSFSIEENLEQLMQVDADEITNQDDKSFAVVQNNTNILSLDFDVSDHSTSPCTVSGPFDRSIGKHSSSFNISSTDQSGFFSKQQGFSSQAADFHSYFSDVGQVFKQTSIQELVESKGQSFDEPQYNGAPQYNATRAPSLAPPGYLASKPPGFSSSGATGQLGRLSRPTAQTSSISNVSNTTVRSYASQPQNAMQQSASVNGDHTLFQTCIQPALPSIQEPSYSGSSFGGLTSSLSNHQQTYSSLTSFGQLPSQAQVTYGHIPNGYNQVRVDDMVGCKRDGGTS